MSKSLQAKSFVLLVAVFLLSLPTLAYANIGVPIIFISLPSMLMALIPIVLMEAMIYRVVLRRPFRGMLYPSFAANIVSTIIGIPLAWVLQLGIQLLVPGGGGSSNLSTFWQKLFAVTVQSAWLVPYEDQLDWMIPVALLVGLIPAFFLTILIEHSLIKLLCKGIEPQALRRGVWWANLASYGFLVLLILGYLTRSIMMH